MIKVYKLFNIQIVFGNYFKVKLFWIINTSRLGRYPIFYGSPFNTALSYILRNFNDSNLWNELGKDWRNWFFSINNFFSLVNFEKLYGSYIIKFLFKCRVAN